MDDSELISSADKLLETVWRSGYRALSLAPLANGHFDIWVHRGGQWTRPTDIDVPMLPPKLLAARIKIFADLDVTEDRMPQRGIAESLPGTEGFRASISTVPTIHGELVTIRLVESKQAAGAEYDKLGLLQSDRELIANTMSARAGLVMVVGPSANGRMTTLYSLTEQFLLPNKRVICAEVAPRRELPGAVLMPVNTKLGLGYDDALMAIRPHDPDAILLGELIDIATVERAMEWAADGKWILTRLNVPKPQDAIIRLLHMGISAVFVGSVLRIVIAQRLIRKLCPSCKGESDTAAYLCVAVGCQACDNTGYAGQQAVFQLLNMTPEVKQCLTEASQAEDPDRLPDILDKSTGPPLRQQALSLAASGVTTSEEAIQKTPED